MFNFKTDKNCSYRAMKKKLGCCFHRLRGDFIGSRESDISKKNFFNTSNESEESADKSAQLLESDLYKVLCIQYKLCVKSLYSCRQLVLIIRCIFSITVAILAAFSLRLLLDGDVTLAKKQGSFYSFTVVAAMLFLAKLALEMFFTKYISTLRYVAKRIEEEMPVSLVDIEDKFMGNFFSALTAWNVIIINLVGYGIAVMLLGAVLAQ